ncbi:hypothetical protein IV203_003263 [Nitzschia inconspicua]|uniref:Uncharacterized protein n=1 Tax=Nitzschia inconspicua TaxID=303405 RepID=A0A9K3PNH6_9STRA|nr:hypothetical protein IV203_003263 [Nitzschia inconspicua]
MTGRRSREHFLLLRILLAMIFAVDKTHAFIFRSGTSSSSIRETPGSSPIRCYNFLDALNKAFENDRSLSKDKTKQQYDAPGEEYIEPNTEALTETQQKWRERQSQINVVSVEDVVGKTFDMDLYLSGVADKDPSNDLYGSRVNISNRDRATGLSLPSEPSAIVSVTFLNDGICQVSSSDFTTDSSGEWKLSDDGKMLRFSMETLGYVRTVETRGSISVVSWSKEEEKPIETKTTYSIPPGMVYCDIGVAPTGRPGSFEVNSDSGVMRVEQSSGIFGISSRLVPCGKFIAKLQKH